MSQITEIAKKRRVLNEIKILTDIEDTRDFTDAEERRHGDLCFSLVNLDLELKEIQASMTNEE